IEGVVVTAQHPAHPFVAQAVKTLRTGFVRNAAGSANLLNTSLLGATGIERWVQVRHRERSCRKRCGRGEVVAVDDGRLAERRIRLHGTRCNHCSLENFESTSACASAYSSAEISPATAPVIAANVALNFSMISARLRPVWVLSGSTRFAAEVVPLSLSFSRPIRNTSVII